jgi:alanine-glyoxylate transaminase / serine-glyoxylate transaminase / serine-pyruvate transaminase
MTSSTAPYLPGRHLLQVPGPTNVPQAVLEAIARPTLDHRGPAFAELALSVIAGLQRVFRTAGPVVIFPGSGTGAWEASLVNTLSPGDKVLNPETGQFSVLWGQVATGLGLDVETLPSDWRHGIDVEALRARLGTDDKHEIQALLITHNETSTGALSDVAAIRGVLDDLGHPALLMVDAVSSLASVDYRHDEWGVDVTIAGSQKGLMLPPGMSFNAISQKALDRQSSAKLPRAYWEWKPYLELNKNGFFPYTPSANLIAGLEVSISLLEREGMENVFARHIRHGEATRAAVRAWGLETQCVEEAAYSPVVTAVRMPEGYPEAEFRAVVLATYGMSLGSGLGQVAGKVFRIGHLGDFDDLSLIAALAGVELSLGVADIPHKEGGVTAALGVLAATR